MSTILIEESRLVEKILKVAKESTWDEVAH